MKYLLPVLLAVMWISSAHAAYFQGSTYTPSGGGDPTSGVLPSANDAFANWQKAGMLSAGGIPNRTTVCATVSPTGVTPPAANDDANTINAAITACPADEVVMLSAGTFVLDVTSEHITIDNGITLRGTGNCTGSTTTTSAGSTTVYGGPYYAPYCQTLITVRNGLVHNNGSETCGTSQSATNSCGNLWPVIWLGPSAFDPWGWDWSECDRDTWVGSNCGGTIALVAADVPQGATTVQVNTTAPFSVGMWVLIDEASGAGPQTDPVASGDQIFGAEDGFNSSNTSALGATGRAIWAKHLPTCCNDDFATADYPYQPGAWGGAWGFVDRPTQEIHKIASIGAGPCPGTACTLTFDSPLTVAFRQSGPINFNGTISGTALSTTSDSCQLTKGMAITNAGATAITDGTYISAVTSCSGGVGHYTVNNSQTVSTSEAMEGAAHIAHIYYPTSSSSATAVPFLENAGVENLSVTRGAGGDIGMVFCAYCWVKNVDASQMALGAVTVTGSARVQIDTLFAHDCWNNTNNGSEYPIDLTWGSTEVYLVNSMTRACGKGMTARAGGAGSVVAYNYMDDQYYGAGSGLEYWVLDASLDGSHYTGSHHILFEGNWAENALNDHVHGNSAYHTYFRDFIAGYRTPFTDIATGTAVNDFTDTGEGNTIDALRAAVPTAYTYWYAFDGNVLGTAGFSTTGNGWSYQSGTGSQAGQNIWDLGSDDSTNSYDTNLSGATGSYIFRHGNYDTVTASVHWDSGTPDHTLPSSFYLAGEPSFFSGASCAYPWPWVTPTAGSQLQMPTGAGCTATTAGDGLPAKARYDAGTPFVQP